MMRSTWRVLAFGALMGGAQLGAGALPASAQVVIGGSGAPSVVVDWSVLDRLGRQPTLADMVKGDGRPPETAVAAPGAQANGPAGVQFKPYKAGQSAKPVVEHRKKVAAKPKKSPVIPASAKADSKIDPAQAVTKAVENSQPAAPAKPQIAAVSESPKAAPAIVGPQISLPELPAKPTETKQAEAKQAEAKPEVKSEPAPKAEAPAAKVETPAVPAKTEIAAAEPAKAEPPKVEAPKVDLPAAALTPPPLPVAPKVAEPAAPQVAALPAAPVASASKSDTVMIPFATDSAHLPDSAQADLDRLVKRMQKDDGLGLQLLAYADGDDANASKARRLSLSRALEVRKYLMDQGLRSTRIEVRALGNKIEGAGQPDRVDAVLVGR